VSEKLIETLEKYSNAIVAFLILQSVAFSITYGTSAHFACVLRYERSLAWGLMVHFLLVAGSGCFALERISKIMLRNAKDEDIQFIRLAWWARIVAIFLFVGMVVVLIAVYGLGHPITDYAQCIKVG